jgi:competence protein ComEC
MPINTGGNLWIFSLNVGQADASIVITPGGKVVIIDAVKPKKLVNLLSQLGFGDGDKISHLVITHPHYDHYSGVERLLNTYDIQGITLSSVFHYSEDKPGYNDIINQIGAKRIPVTFVSGYVEHCPDDNPIRDPKTLRVQLLGPSNQMIEELEEAGRLTTNHRSIIARLQWKNFIMIIAGDAQMENWTHFDREQLLDDSCAILRTAHHGSANGTQFERLNRLAPEYVYVSSDPNGRDKLPDLIACATFMRYSDTKKAVVALTKDTGSIKTKVESSGRYEVYFFDEDAHRNVPLGNKQRLTRDTNPSDWEVWVQDRMQLHHKE